MYVNPCAQHRWAERLRKASERGMGWPSRSLPQPPSVLDAQYTIRQRNRRRRGR